LVENADFSAGLCVEADRKPKSERKILLAGKVLEDMLNTGGFVRSPFIPFERQMVHLALRQGRPNLETF